MEYVAIASAAFQAIGAIQNANAAQSNYQAQAQAAAYNAEVSRQRADNALQVANANEEAQRRKARQIIGAQRAGLAESGVDMTSGTGLDLLTQSYTNAELDSQNIRYEGQLNAKGLRDQAGLYDYEGRVATYNADQMPMRGFIGAGAAALSGYGGYVRARTGGLTR